MRTKPRHRSVDTSLLVGAHEVHAVVGLAGAEDRNLGHAVAMRDVILNQHFTEPVGWGQRINVAVVVIRPNLGDDGDLARGVEGFTFPVASIDDREPEAQVNGGIARESCATISSGDRWHRHVNRAYRIDGIRAVDAYTCVDVRIVVRQFSSVPRFGVDIFRRAAFVHDLGFSETTSEHARRKEQHDQHGLQVHGQRGTKE